jgi:hypothetical protein
MHPFSKMESIYAKYFSVSLKNKLNNILLKENLKMHFNQFTSIIKEDVLSLPLLQPFNLGKMLQTLRTPLAIIRITT